MSPTDGLLLVAHGSRSAQGVADVGALGHLVSAALPGTAVEVGFLELSDPPAPRMLDRLVERGCARVVTLPLILLGAGHAKSDVPAIALGGRARHAGVDIRMGSPLGLGQELVATLGRAVVEAGAAELPLLVVARGTSDPDANGDAYKAARLVAEWAGSRFVHTAFTGVTWPSVAQGLDLFAQLGHRRLAAAFWFLGHGTLIERARAEFGAFTARTGIDIVDAGYLGPHPDLVPAIVNRYQQALAGVATVNCDLCAHRSAWPGLEDRVGQPLGVGLSHLAAAHRHS